MNNQSQPPPHERVLVVDDSREIRDFLSEYILRPRGFEVITAGDGLEGLKLAFSENPDLMIVDLQMPHMTGIELLRRLRVRRITIPAILITAHGSEQVAVEAFRLGVRDYVIKPFVVEEMQEAVDRALRESRLEKERDDLVKQLVESNARLRSRSQELNTFYGIGKSVSSSLDLEQVLHRIVDAAVYLSGAEQGTLMLVDEKTGELYIRAFKKVSTETTFTHLRAQDTTARQVLQTKQTTILNKPPSKPFPAGANQTQSSIYIPLTIRGQSLGILTVAKFNNTQPFDNRHARALSTLASYATIALVNATLYNESTRERNQLRAILSQIENPVLVLDDHCHFILANKSAHEVFDIPEGNFIGRPIADLLSDPQAINFMAQSVGPDLERYAVLKSSNNRQYNANLTLIEGVGRSIVLHDITRLNELNKIKSELMTVLSHDLRSPLTNMLGYVDLLEQTANLNESQLGYLHRVRENITKIGALVAELLDVGRIEAGQGLSLTLCHPVQILKTILQSFDPVIQKQQLTLEVKADPAITLMADEVRLNQAFSNLVSNAIKYTPAGGHISLKIFKVEDQVLFQVQDTGIGIDPVDQPYIFEKFYRAHNVSQNYPGAGLGLAIVKSIVEQHQGRIVFETAPGKGTTFTMAIPSQLNVTPPAS